MKRLTSLFVIVALCLSSGLAQQTSNSNTAAVPHLVRFGGLVKDVGGRPLTGSFGITFALYRDQEGGPALWLETQNVSADNNGHYTVSLGSTKTDGLPVELFTSGEARWLGVQPDGQAEQPRVLLLSVPYALKAADAETVGGLPPSAFMLAVGPSSAPTAAAATTSSAASSAPPPATVTGSGTVNLLPLWTGTSTIGNSVLFQSGTGSAAKIGLGTTTPGATLDVKGAANVQGLLTSPATSAATSAGGKPSQAQDFVASSFSSIANAAVNQTFQWKAEAANNNTATPSGTLNLLFGSGTATPTETGLRLNSKGLFTFAVGQTFPGTGTITGVTTATGSGLSGGGTTGSLTLSLLKTCSANQVLEWNGNAWACSSAGSGTVTGVTAGTDLTGGGTNGNVTLNLDTTKVPQLGGTNAFSTNNSFAGTVGIGTTAPAAQLDVEAPATAATGIQGVTSSTTFFAAGVYGHATGASGTTRGVYGVSDSTGGIGVHGIGAVGGQFETGNGTIFVGRGQGGTRVTIDSLGNTITTGAMSVGNGLTASATNGVGVAGNSPGIGVQGVSAGSGGLGVEGVATSSGTGGVGVEGFGDVGVAGNGGTSGTGVRGGGAIGVEGSSPNGDGVVGKNTSGAAGVSGVNNGNGYGLFGFAAGSSGQGVHGESMGTSASNGLGADGVDGITHTPNGSGVAGINDGLGGTGVYGVSTNGGFGFVTPSNVSQDRSAGGWAKALIFVDPFTTNGTAITRCYNSQASGATVSTPPCGFDITHIGQGGDIIDLHFQVNDRFLSVSSGALVTTCVQDPNTCPGNSVTQLSVATANFNGSAQDAAFWVIVF